MNQQFQFVDGSSGQGLGPKGFKASMKMQTKTTPNHGMGSVWLTNPIHINQTQEKQ